MNFGDLVTRQGAIDNPPKTPFVLGYEVSGVVEGLGENTDRFDVSVHIFDYYIRLHKTISIYICVNWILPSIKRLFSQLEPLKKKKK